MSSSGGKVLVFFDHAHIACLFFILLTSPRGYDDSSSVFSRETNIRAKDCIVNKRNHVKIYVKTFFQRLLCFCRTSGESYVWHRL